MGMSIFKKYVHLLNLPFLVLLGAFAKFSLVPWLSSKNITIASIFMAIIFIIGIFLIQKTAKIIEETTGVLKDRTGVASGLLQSLGTAFPDMVIGVVSAVLSLQAASTDYTRSVNLAIIAASTTFGSNIYNVAHAAWCVFRQNVADRLGKKVAMFPYLGVGGSVHPIKTHKVKPKMVEFDIAIKIFMMLSFLTAIVALGMVLFGKVPNPPKELGEDVYKLSQIVALVVFIASAWIMYTFRKSQRSEATSEPTRYDTLPTFLILAELAVSGIVIIFAAESIIEVISRFSEITKVPFVVTGIATALVGCLGEMTVIHNFTINPNGRLADAVVGVAMDNIVTTMGAAFIAIIGGIFLGGSALIVIFVLILFANAVVMQQISELKNYFLVKPLALSGAYEGMAEEAVEVEVTSKGTKPKAKEQTKQNMKGKKAKKR